VFLLLFLDTGCVHLISLMWLEDVIASSSVMRAYTAPKRHHHERSHMSAKLHPRNNCVMQSPSTSSHSFQASLAS